MAAHIGRGFRANDFRNQAEGDEVVVQLIGLPGGITPPGHERRVFRMVVIVGAMLIVAALIFMSWQKSPAEHPVQKHFPFSQSK